MRFDPIRARRRPSDNHDAPTFDFGKIARALVLLLIERQDDLAERRAWIAIAHRDGHLSDDEAAGWLATIEQGR